MVLLSKINEDAIVENLKKRYMDDYIFVSLSLEMAAHRVVKHTPPPFLPPSFPERMNAGTQRHSSE